MPSALMRWRAKVDDYLERRSPLQERHLVKVRDGVEKGELVLAGALADPVNAAVAVFRADSAETAARFAQADP
jgi:uncharacterized protein YciI